MFLRSPADKNKPTGPGRPPNGLIESLRGQVWVNEIQNRTGKYGGSALERFFEPEKVVYDPEDGVTRRPCKYDKYVRRDHLPLEETVELVEAQLPGSRHCLEHPFWNVIQWPHDSIESLYSELMRLRPKIRRHLFNSFSRNQRMPLRQQESPLDTIENLKKHSDWDACTAAIGLIQEADYLGQHELRDMLARPAHLIFVRSFTRTIFLSIAGEIFPYLKKSFFYIRDPELVPQYAQWNRYLDTANVYDSILFRHFVLSVIEDLDLLKTTYMAPLSCLQIAEKYFSPTVCGMVEEFLQVGDKKSIHSIKEIQNLKRALRRWEKNHTSGFDNSNPRSHH